jgi:hypothetical protein
MKIKGKLGTLAGDIFYINNRKPLKVGQRLKVKSTSIAFRGKGWQSAIIDEIRIPPESPYDEPFYFMGLW